MAGPPTDIPASSLFLKLLERPAPTEVVDFGGDIGHIRIMVLRGDQQDQAREAARRSLREKKLLADDDLRSDFGQEILGDAVARELLALSCFMPAPIEATANDIKPVYPRVFRTGDEVNKLNPDEIRQLFGAYLLVQRRYGPGETSMNNGETNAWVTRLVEGGSLIPLGQLALFQRDELIGSLAERAYSLSSILESPLESLPKLLESIPQSWRIGTSSFTEPAVSSTQSSEARTITQEEAIAAAREVMKRNQ